MLIFTFILSTFVKLIFTIMHNRLKQFIAAENISQAQFAERIKIGKANVSHVLAGRNKPGYDFITAILTGFPQLNINWLFFGTGKMYTSQSSPSPADRSQAPSYTSDLLFANIDDEPVQHVEITPVVEDIKENFKTLTLNENLNNDIKQVNKQRVVSKIIVLFDDGTFQEL